MSLEKNNHPEISNQDPERQTWYFFPYMYILVVK